MLTHTHCFALLCHTQDADGAPGLEDEALMRERDHARVSLLLKTLLVRCLARVCASAGEKPHSVDCYPPPMLFLSTRGAPCFSTVCVHDHSLRPGRLLRL